MLEALLPGLGKACGYWAALSLERRPSDGHRHSCPPLASSCFESAGRETERWHHYNKREKGIDSRSKLTGLKCSRKGF